MRTLKGLLTGALHFRSTTYVQKLKESFNLCTHSKSLVKEAPLCSNTSRDEIISHLNVIGLKHIK